MGMRFWLKTANEPKFHPLVKWQKLDDYVEDMWFFQDEWDDPYVSLATVLGFNPSESSKGMLKHAYWQTPVVLLTSMSQITDEKIVDHFNNSFDRPVPYWEEMRTISMVYMQSKVQYLKDLLHAGVTCCLQERMDLPSSISQWYWYRGLGYDEETNPMTFSRR